MANLVETARWEAGIYQFETSDPVMGGPNGIDNRPTRELANRTLWLKTELAAAVQSIGSNKTAADAAIALKADKAVIINAGAGMTGGGDLSASRTISLGTPSTITASSSNSVGSNTHSHAIDKASTTVAGIVQLSSATDSIADNLAATPKAVKAAYDLAAAKKDNFSNILILDGAAANLGLTATAAANGWIWEVGADGVAKMIQRDKSRFTANAGNVQLFKMPTNKGTNETFAMLSDIQAATGIKSGVNLDTHTEHGFFSWSGTTGGGTLPIGGDWAGVVIGYANDCTQIISSAGRLWVRGADANPITQASDWSAWRELLNSGNGVMLAGDQTIAGIKTFSDEIKGNNFITLSHRWPKLQLSSSGGNQALLLESGGVAGTHCLIIRPHTDGVVSGSNIAKFMLPAVTGDHTLATRADLVNVSRRDYSRTVTPPKASTERVQTVGNVTVYPDGRIVQFFHLQHISILWFLGSSAPSIGYSANSVSGWFVDIPLWTAMPNRVTAVYAQTVRSSNTQSSMIYEAEAAEHTVAWAYSRQGTRKNGVQIDAARIAGAAHEHIDLIVTVEGF